MKKQYAVIGMGRFGHALAIALAQMGHEVLAVDSNEENVDEISPYVTQAAQADSTDEEALRDLGIQNLDCVIVAMTSDIQSSIMTTLLCKEMGVGMVVSKAADEMHAKVLKRIGADRVVFPERDMAVRVAHSLNDNNILEHLNISLNYSIMELVVPEQWFKKSIAKLELNKRYNVTIIAICRQRGLNASPRGDDIVDAGDVMIIVGQQKDIEKLEKSLDMER